MRITYRLEHERRVADLMRGEERLAAARDQVSTGRRIQRPSDAPDEIGELLRVRSDLAVLTQRQAAADAALPGMQASDSALGDIATALHEVRTFALQAQNSTASTEQRQVLGDQIDHIRTRMVDLANTQVSGRYLFAGTNTDIQPFSAGPAVNYTGNNSSLQASLTAGPPFDTSVTGGALLNRRGGTDLFQNLSDLAAAIRSGDSSTITTGLTGLDEDIHNVVRLRADMGARIQYVNAAKQKLGDDLAAAQQHQSKVQDADLASALLDARSAENAHEAALAMAGRIDRPSLLDYLR